MAKGVNFNFIKNIAYYYLESNFFRINKLSKFEELLKKFGFKNSNDIIMAYKIMYDMFKKHNKFISLIYYKNFSILELRIKLSKNSFICLSNKRIYKNSAYFLSIFFKICHYSDYEKLLLGNYDF